jgi:DNA modification methylase
MSVDNVLTNLRTPKRPPTDSKSRSEWFSFYAGFSAGFVEDVIRQLDLKAGTTLLDPWLGSGTTGEIASATGVNFKGYDINPAVLLVAKARTFSNDDDSDLFKFADKAIDKFERAPIEDRRRSNQPPDPLEQWLQPRSAAMFRRLERSISRLDHSGSYEKPTWQRIGQISNTTSVLYIALFRTLRHFIAPYRSSNPTWIKLCDSGSRIRVSAQSLVNRFVREVTFLQKALDAEERTQSQSTTHRSTISRASSIKLPIQPNSIDAIISSPPYCTRIDYVRATLPELSVIGFPSGTETRKLRHMMIGTPTIYDSSAKNGRNWGPTCNGFLTQVENHYSKASSTYYIKYFRQYFESAFSSLTELQRVLKKSGQCVLVVQNSYYKEVLNDLPAIFSEMASQVGLRLTNRTDFQVGRTLAGIHPQTKHYRNDFRAVESVLMFLKQ